MSDVLRHRAPSSTVKPVPVAPVDLAPVDTTGFADRVMSAIRNEPAPTPTRSFMAALRARSPRDAGSALWVAWHLGTVRRWSVDPRVRVRSMALVLAVSGVLMTGSLAAAGVVRVAAEPIVQLLLVGQDQHGPAETDGPGNGQEGPAGNEGSGNDEQGPVQQDADDALDGDPSGVDADEDGDEDADTDTDDADDDDGASSNEGTDGDADEDDGAGGDAGASDGSDASHGSDGDGGEGSEETEEPDEASPTANPGDHGPAEEGSSGGGEED
jgi:hypothetical protein